MSRLSDLIRQAKSADAQLGADLEREFRALAKRRAFGLVFERHQPEAVELPGRSIRKGDKVRVLPLRGGDTRGDQRLWTVAKFEGAGADRTAHLVETCRDEDPESTTALVTNLVVIAEFRDHIYPGLVETGRVERGGDKPFHTVINSENFHALEMLTYTHHHAIDAIYIDPPYNTGAKDWKYNNDYVESDDDYRHSKWLAMMERRLLIARELLNPCDSVLIVTIDEKEYLRLGLLLEQTFPEAQIQMVSSQINPAAVARIGQFGRSDEYLFFVMLGGASPLRLPLSGDWVTNRGRTHKGNIRWDLLRRSAESAARKDRPGMFYPIFVKHGGLQIASIGDPLPPEAGRDSVPAPAGEDVVWPIRKDGSEGRWRLGPAAARAAWKAGYLRVGSNKGENSPVYYLAQGEQKKIADGTYQVLGRGEDGSVITSQLETAERNVIPPTQWRITSHDSTQYGSRLISQLLPDRKFPFPKSLYAVEDTLRFFISDKPDALVLDFFAGSGTTTHAVMRLNKQDDGRRQCILVTNNEVSAAEQTRLRGLDLRPGDSEWEALGICDYITKPRLTAAITGLKPDGEPIKGEYKFTDEFPMSEGFEENAAFFTLTYEGPLSVAHHRAFARIAPMLWLRAGARGRIILELGDKGWDATDAYGVLDDLDAAASFVTAVKSAPDLRIAFIVTDDDLAFQMVCRELPERVRPVRLYGSYLQNFEINSGRFA